jgi:signal transduction histidine kinase
MKTKLLLLVMAFSISKSFAQKTTIDSLNNELSVTNNDTLRLVLSNLLSRQWLNVNSDSSIYYTEQYLELSAKLEYHINEADALSISAFNNIYLGNHPKALETLFKANSILESNTKNEKILPGEYLKLLKIPTNLQSFNKFSLYIEGNIQTNLAFLYWINYKEDGKLHAQKAGQIAKEIKAADLEAYSYLWKATNSSDIPDSTIYYAIRARDLYLESKVYWMAGACEEICANAFHNKGDHESELKYLRSGLNKNLIYNNIRNSGWSYTKLSDYFLEKGNVDSVIFYARKALSVSVEGNYPDIKLKAVGQLADVFKSINKIDSSYIYLQLWTEVQKKSLSYESARQFENIQNSQLQHKIELIAAQERYRNRMKLFGLLAGLSVLLIFTIVLFLNNKQKKRANAFLLYKNEEVEKQKNIAEKTLSELKSTQAQLIQSEKMASLGELTAGIAHEIQNPLNFVNNFSEVSNELVEELKIKNDKLKIEDEEVRDLLNDIAGNLEKINHHGKRADAIVKGMLQHSRTSTGQKESTDINALCDEYLRLAYHGMRAKDKSFNADFKTEFDPNLPKINVIPQDIGRVLLNLINNAFYAVDKRAKDLTPLPSRSESGTGSEGGVKNTQLEYRPTVIISTISSKSPLGDLGVEIRVKDNGPGIPSSIIDKIFQPFFTTKPTGQGTGLGLSLSYDIVKAHGGEIKVETKDGEGTEFIIQLSIS